MNLSIFKYNKNLLNDRINNSTVFTQGIVNEINRYPRNPKPIIVEKIYLLFLLFLGLKLMEYHYYHHQHYQHHLHHLLYHNISIHHHLLKLFFVNDT